MMWARHAALTLVFSGQLKPFLFTRMVVEPQAAAGNIGYVREAVIFVDLNNPVLQVLRVTELPAVDDSGFLEQGAAGKSVKIRACDESHPEYPPKMCHSSSLAPQNAGADAP